MKKHLSTLMLSFLCLTISMSGITSIPSDKESSYETYSDFEDKIKDSPAKQ